MYSFTGEYLYHLTALLNSYYMFFTEKKWVKTIWQESADLNRKLLFFFWGGEVKSEILSINRWLNCVHRWVQNEGEFLKYFYFLYKMLHLAFTLIFMEYIILYFLSKKMLLYPGIWFKLVLLFIMCCFWLLDEILFLNFYFSKATHKSYIQISTCLQRNIHTFSSSLLFLGQVVTILFIDLGFLNHHWKIVFFSTKVVFL